MEAVTSARLLSVRPAPQASLSRSPSYSHQVFLQGTPLKGKTQSLILTQIPPQRTQCLRRHAPSQYRHSRPVSASASSSSALAPSSSFAAPVEVLPVLTFDGSSNGEAELKLKTAKAETAKGLVHRAVVTFMQNKRRGTASTLTRSEVRGGGKKPFKQKGTGNARRGSQRTPLRPGGGVVFGPKPKDWSIRMNKKERLLAIGTALKSAAANMTVVQDLIDTDFPLPKTREFVSALARWGIDYKEDSTLFVTNELTRNVELSCRNIQKLKVTTPLGINIYDILRADKLVVTLSGLEALNRRFGGSYDNDDDDEATQVVLRMMGIDLVLEEGEEGESIVLASGELEGEDETSESEGREGEEEQLDDGVDVETEDAEDGTE